MAVPLCHIPSYANLIHCVYAAYRIPASFSSDDTSERGGTARALANVNAVTVEDWIASGRRCSEGTEVVATEEIGGVDLTQVEHS